MKDKRKILRIVSLILLVLAVLFIWGNSLKPGHESLEDSGAAVGFIQEIFAFFGIDAEVSELIVRKVAHFTEYFVLGALACFAAWQYDLRGKQYICAGGCAVVAIIDETIQSFVPGRDGNSADVLIDIIGAVCAIAVILLLIFLIKIRKEKNSKNT